MKVLTFGAALFITAILVHILIWRFHPPKNHIKALFLIFAITLILGLLLFRKMDFSPFSVAIFFTSLALAYISNYSAVEAESPTISIISKIADAGSKGAAREDIKFAMGDDTLILPRVNDLVRGGLISLSGGRYTLRPRGRLLARIFILLRTLMKADEIGG